MNIFEEKEDHIKVIVKGTKNEGYFLIDKEDLDLIKKYSWSIKDSNNTNPRGYVAAKINGRTVKLHRYILNVTDSSIKVDHISRDVWDNRRKNLRECDSSTNNKNVSFSRNNTSGRTGVKYKEPKDRPPRWTAQVDHNGKRKTKDFSVKKYGYEEAYKLAVEQRELWEKEYNIITDKERSETIETTTVK